MKKLLPLLFLLFFLSSHICFAQGKKNILNIGLGVSPPIKANGMGMFFNENWVVSDNGIERKYYRINFLLNADYFINENVFLRAAGGLTIRNISEVPNSMDSTVFSGIDWYRLTSNSHFNYKQLNWNISLGMGYKTQAGKFSPYFGSDLIYIRYGKGIQTYYYYYNQDNITQGIAQIYEYTYYSKIPSGNAGGIGVFGGVDFSLKHNLILSFEISEYYLYMYFNGNFQTHAVGHNDNVYYDTYSYEHEKLQQLAFSNLIPKFSIKYSFNNKHKP